MIDKALPDAKAGVLFGGRSTLGTREGVRGWRGRGGDTKLLLTVPSQTFLGAHLERVRDLVGRWLPDLNPGTVVITLDISPPIAAGFAFNVLFLSDDVNMDVRYVQA